MKTITPVITILSKVILKSIVKFNAFVNISGLILLAGIALSPFNLFAQLYIAQSNNAIVKMIKPTGGYYINPQLPTGLTFNNSTGVIGGTAPAASPAVNYKITAYNYSGAATATANIKVNLPPAPTIKYATPQTLGLNISATITPTASGVSAPGFSANKANIATGLATPGNVAIDTSGNIYISSYYDNVIEKIPAGGGTPVTIGYGIANPLDITLDPAGNLFVLARDGKNLIYKIAAGTGVISSISYSGYTTPNSIAIDPAGNLYVTDIGDNSVKKSTLSSGSYGSPVTLANNLTGPIGIALDNAGNIFVADNTDVVEIPFTSGTYGAYVTLATGFAGTSSITPDIFGNLFVSDFSARQFYEIPIATGNPVVIASGFGAPAGVAIDSKGILYVCDEDSTNVKQIKPTGGYYLSPALPAGLSFNNATGNISGTPTALSPATAYTATAYNNYSEAGSTTLSLAVTNPSANDNLSALKTSVGTLSPAFAAGTLSYIESVAYTSSQITVTPTTADNSAKVTVNGTTVTSGAASAPITVLVGINTINVVVTSQTGATQTYTITVTRAASTNAALAGIALSKGTLSPAFAAATTSYTDMVTNGTTSVTLTPTVSNTQATVKVNGITVKSGVASGPITLSVGSNMVPVIVTAPDGKTTETYTVNIIRPSTNAKLASLTINAGTLTPAFNTNTTSYMVNELYAQSSIKLTPTVTTAGATVTINGTAVASGTTSGFIILKVGANTVTTVVTAQDGVTTDTYTLTVIRAAPATNSNLSGITLSKGTLTPTFASSTINYSAMETNGTTSITITPTTQVTTSTVMVNGTAVVSGHASGAITLAVGTNAIPVVVTAQDGTTKRTYTVNVIRPSTNAKLGLLKISSGILSPAFNTNTTTYTDAVTNATTSITVTPTIAAAGATIKVNGTTVASGAASGSIALAVGPNKITTVVTAQDGVTTDTYTITVTRAAVVDNTVYQPVSVDKPTGDLHLADDGITVHQGVSPNGDGISDFLQIDNISLYPDNKLTIMNRNGQLVYEAKGYDNATKVFDGHSNKNGQMQLPGTYFYSLYYAVNGIIKHKTGFLVLKY